MLVRVLAAAEGGHVLAPERRHQVVDAAFGGAPVQLRVAEVVVRGEQRGLEVEPREPGVVLEHLLVVGHAPVALGGVAEEAALHVVVHAPARHGGQRRAYDLVHARRPEQGAAALGHVLRVAGAAQHPVGEHEAVHVRLRELGLRAEAAAERVEPPHDLQRHLGGDVAGYVRVAVQGLERQVAVQRDAGEPGEGGAVTVAGALALQRDDLGLVGVEERLDAREALQHLVGREVGPAGEDVPAGGEERRRRPAAHVVAAVHVGVAVVVHADGHEVLVDGGDHARVGVARLVHDVAPVAPDGRE